MANSKICSISGCGKNAYARGWCAMHYQRWRHHGDLNANFAKSNIGLSCKVQGCVRKVKSKGWCYRHYMQVWKTGSLTTGPEEPLHKEIGRKNHCGARSCRPAWRLGRQVEYAKNPARFKALALDWSRTNKIKRKAISEKWISNNIGKRLKSGKRRRPAIRNGTPKWITSAHRAEMAELYATARKLTQETGEQYDVDHIVPLLGKTVCGLHVPWNLRVMRNTENNKRPRVWDPDASP